MPANRTKPQKRVVTAFRLPPKLLHDLDTVLSHMELPPTRTVVVEKLLTQFVKERAPQPTATP